MFLSCSLFLDVLHCGRWPFVVMTSGHRTLNVCVCVCVCLCVRERVCVVSGIRSSPYLPKGPQVPRPTLAWPGGWGQSSQGPSPWRRRWCPQDAAAEEGAPRECAGGQAPMEWLSSPTANSRALARPGFSHQCGCAASVLEQPPERHPLGPIVESHPTTLGWGG